MSATSELTSPAFERGRHATAEEPNLAVDEIRLAFKGVKANPIISLISTPNYPQATRRQDSKITARFSNEITAMVTLRLP